MKLRFKQYFCKHEWEMVAKHRVVNETIRRCSKCNVYWLLHEGLRLGHKFNIPAMHDWIKPDL